MLAGPNNRARSQGRLRPQLRYSALAAVLALFVCHLALAKETVVFLNTWEPAFQDRQLEFDRMFMERHPDIEVLSESVGFGQLIETFTVRTAAGVAPDLVPVHYTWAQSFIMQGLLANIQGWIERDASAINFPDFLEVGLAPYKDRQGDLYALPYDIGPVILFYNVDAFAEAGIGAPAKEWTLKGEFLEAARKLTLHSGDRVTQWGFSRPSFSSAAVMDSLFLQPFGGHVVDEMETLFLLDSPESIDALTYWIELEQTFGVTGPGASFNGNNAAMEFNGSWNIPTKLAQVTSTWDVAHMPAGPVRRATAAAGSGIGITAPSAHKEAAWVYLKELLSPEGQAFMWGRTGRGSPSRRSVWPEFLAAPGAPPNGQVFPDALVEYASIGRLLGPAAPAANRAISTTMPRAFAGEISLANALEIMRAAIVPELNTE